MKDPVCGMDVDPATAAGHAEFQGTTYYFCSARCQARFEAEPSLYLTAAPAKHGCCHDHGAVTATPARACARSRDCAAAPSTPTT